MASTKLQAQLLSEYVESFNNRDLDKMTILFTEDATYSEYYKENLVLNGREEITNVLKEFLDTTEIQMSVKNYEIVNFPNNSFMLSGKFGYDIPEHEKHMTFNFVINANCENDDCKINLLRQTFEEDSEVLKALQEEILNTHPEL